MQTNQPKLFKKITRGEKSFFLTYRSYRNQLIKELLNELRQFLKKTSDYHFFFVHSSHTARLFILTIFFEKVSVTFYSLKICKNISDDYKCLFYVFFCVRVFFSQFRHNVYILSFLCHSAKWVSIFENLES